MKRRKLNENEGKDIAEYFNWILTIVLIVAVLLLAYAKWSAEDFGQTEYTCDELLNLYNSVCYGQQPSPLIVSCNVTPENITEDSIYINIDDLKEEKGK